MNRRRRTLPADVPAPPADGRSDLDRLGGIEAVDAVMRTFIRRVAEDPIIGFRFVGKDLDHIARMEGELAVAHLAGSGPHAGASGAPRPYTGRSLPSVHRPLGINRGQFRRRMFLLRKTLEEAGCDAGATDRWIAREQALESVVAGPHDCIP